MAATDGLPLKSLQLWDYSDRELLLMVDDHTNGRAALSAEIAAALAIDNPRRNQCVGTRLGFLRRAGAVQHGRKEKVSHPTRWELTDEGRALAHGRLPAGFTTQMGKLDDTALLLVARTVARRAVESNHTTATLTKREWRHTHGR